jgi:hemerythrin
MIEIIRWSPAWQNGIAHIDNQHKRLVELLANLQRQMNDSRPRVSTLEALVSLSAYIELHFADEEHIMSQLEYPKIELHRQQHQQFVARAMKFAHAYRLGDAELTDEIAQFLATWLVQHISSSDVELAAFIKRTGIDPSTFASFPSTSG